MTRSRGSIDSIVRYPVKGLSGVPARDPVRLDPGRGLRGDRAFAIARRDSIDATALASIVADLDLEQADASVCGPPTFAAAMRALLVQSGFAPERVHVDLFSSPASSEWGPPRVPRADVPLRVDSAAGSFVWEPAAGSLLNAAESAGLDWPSECRVGVCGTCVRTVTHGEFEYLNEPLCEPGPGRVAVCSAAPLTPLRLDGAAPGT
ncbi:3-ketosteroid-9-alpha-monooxygenase, ferredoxin reductase component [Microbacterium oxydans]|uniref:3-ketosteroid-9-alpha-monooxygenase, ferredoxin reductase component n=1 Tax=Microbacterium oxydans TaxID=82380 RepID=A0A3Q9J300_9MICO|nr:MULTISPECIES: 2Fe-2S iron-sulfur cluster-binding protein [Microbacterium]AZS38755.1 3-ketosteroid-9-alpha-monooxygenase, ferredoxin reductase component [Microbacterium oxydans]